MWKICTNSHSTLTFCLVTDKMTCLEWTIYSWQGLNSIGWTLMLRTNYIWVQSLYISVDVAKCVKIFTNSPSTLTFCLLQQMTCLDRTIYSRQSFNSLRSPLMFRTNCRCLPSLNISENFAKYVEKYSQIHPVHTLFVCYKKWLVLTEESISWQGFNSLWMSSYAKNKQ